MNSGISCLSLQYICFKSLQSSQSSMLLSLDGAFWDFQEAAVFSRRAQRLNAWMH